MIKTVFFSWQNDLPQNTTTRVIRSALRDAHTKLEEESVNLTLQHDEATSNEPGSPNIPATIQKKIKAADIFIADVSTVVIHGEKEKEMPNSNVMFELGFAVATLGWSRIVLLYNTSFGELVNLPFDIDRQRISKFKFDANSGKKEKGDLVELLSLAIGAILKHDPVMAMNENVKLPSDIKRERDVAFLRLALSTIHLPTLDDYISDMPFKFHKSVNHFWIGFSAVMERVQTHVNDERIRNIFSNLKYFWGKSLSHGDAYNGSNLNEYFTFSRESLNLTSAPKVERQISKEIRELRRCLTDMVLVVSERYTEIDLDETSQTAWHEYVAWQRDHNWV